jgi:hypothetical protein
LVGTPVPTDLNVNEKLVASHPSSRLPPGTDAADQQRPYTLRMPGVVSVYVATEGTPANETTPPSPSWLPASNLIRIVHRSLLGS